MSAAVRELSIDRHPNAASALSVVAQRTADLLCAQPVRAVMGGGRTPPELNCRIVRELAVRQRSPVSLRVFVSDERHVSLDHPDSNAGMLRSTLAEPLGLASECVAAIRVDAPPDAAAEHYTSVCRDAELPGGFELAVLGLGSDGHTASLFPGASTIGETRARVVSAGRGPDGHDRLTMTLPLLCAAQQIWLVALGAAKADAVARLLSPDGSVAQTPARGLLGGQGELVVTIDEEAAAQLPD